MAIEAETTQSVNVDPAELQKFASLAHRWWDKTSEFKPLHEINPLRLNYIDGIVSLQGKRVLDVGCGGGILSESMAHKGANVTGIDLGEKALGVAKLHLLESGETVEYRHISVEDLAKEAPGSYDVVTCMEMLEHVPDPAAVVKACAELVKDGGSVFFSTINRNPKAYLLAVIGAEYVLNMLPKGTHDYAKFIKPSELVSWSRTADLSLQGTKGMTYNPLTKRYRLSSDVAVNYILHRPEISLETIRPFASHGSKGLLALGFDLTPDDADFNGMRDQYLDLYEEVFTQSPVLFDGVMDLLAGIEKRGLAWGIVTNKPRRFSAPLLKAIGLHERMACLVCGDDALKPKPAPDTLLMACEQVAVSPKDCFYVGDAVRDIEAGISAGMRTVIAMYGYIGDDDKPEEWGADFKVDQAIDVLAILND